MKILVAVLWICLALYIKYSKGCGVKQGKPDSDGVECRDHFINSTLKAMNTRLSYLQALPKGFPVHIQLNRATPFGCCTALSINNMEYLSCEDIKLTAVFWVKYRKVLHEENFVTEPKTVAKLSATFDGVMLPKGFKNNCSLHYFSVQKLPDALMEQVTLPAGIISPEEFEMILWSNLRFLHKQMPLFC